MPLQAGSSIGSYELVGPLGVGGMGEVYRARDTRLNREVALKLLPSTFSADPDRLARFTRDVSGGYDVSPDGRTLYLARRAPVRTDQPTMQRYVLIQTWIAEFSRPR